MGSGLESESESESELKSSMIGHVLVPSGNGSFDMGAGMCGMSLGNLEWLD